MVQVPGGKQNLTDVALLAEVRVGLREPTRGGEAPREQQDWEAVSTPAG